MDLQKTFFTVQSRKELFYRILIVVVVIAGIMLRASKYLPGWSMRGDELSVTLSLISRSAVDLATKPLDREQAAPIGFLLTVKALITILGPSEYVLRLVAFVTGCFSLVLMYWLLNRIIGRYGTLFALVAFAASYYLIYYSAEIKQYSSDVFVTLVLAVLFNQHISQETNKSDFWVLGIAGALAICFSHPAIFVVIPMGFALLLFYWKDRQAVIWLLLIGAVWAGTFLSIYLILLRYQTTSPYLITFWGDLNSYMPLRFWRNPGWFPSSLEHLFTNIGGLSGDIPIILFVLYAYGLWRFWKEGKWQWIIVTTFPIGINMVVSSFEKFPFHGRLIMYLLPLVFVVFGKAIDGIIAFVPNRYAASLLFVVLAVLLLRPAAPTAYNFLFTKSYVQDDLKPVLAFMREAVQPDDSVYLYHYVDQKFEYYAPHYNLEGLTTFNGHDYSRNGEKYQDELSSLPRGQRIWFLFTFVGDVKIDRDHKQNERDYMLDYLNSTGSLLSEYYSENDASSAHLYILK